MRYQLIDIDNQSSAGAMFIGTKGAVKYDGVRFYFQDLYSSTVSSIEHYDGNLTGTTRNSVYKFKKVEDEPQLV